MNDTPQPCSEQPKDTPRTDSKAVFFGFNPDDGEEFVTAKFSRDLERELHQSGKIIQSFRDQLHKTQMTNKVLLTLCEEVQTLVLKSPNEALIRRWFADLRAVQKDMERG